MATPNTSEIPIARKTSGIARDLPPILSSAIDALLAYCRAHGWAGYDPYDALNSRLLQRARLLSWRLPRLALTQFLKRSPVNFRPLLMVPREQNPKGIAIFLSALVKLGRHRPAEAEEARLLATRLLDMRSPEQPHFCWGYNFDWQTRTYLVPRGTPNIICTTFAANALLDAFDASGDVRFFRAAQSAGDFLLSSLNRTETGNSFCFSYTPLDRSQIHNASLLGAALLARLYSHEPAESFRSASLAACQFSLERQRADGSWPYGEAPRQQWIDSFHTGYNLVALERVRTCLGLADYQRPIQTGYRFFLEHFFEPDGRVKYFHNRLYPIDVHSIAQALVTLVTLDSYDLRSRDFALSVCAWALHRFRSAGGNFFYQRWPFWTNRISYMRWSQAWMLLALAGLAESLWQKPIPFPLHSPPEGSLPFYQPQF